jgi:hypothetical protein
MIEQKTPEGFRTCTVASTGGPVFFPTGRVFEATRNDAGRLVWAEVAEYLPRGWQGMEQREIIDTILDTAPYELRLGIAPGCECE